MTPNSYKRAFFLTAFLGLVLIAVAGKLLYDHLLLSLRVSFAEDQTTIFDEMRAKALASSPRQAVECLEYTVNYYPSGTKQIPGSKLDQIVERARQSAIRDMLADLRARTGRNFGDDPKRWIDEFSQHKD
jgi:hypothetical protein